MIILSHNTKILHFAFDQLFPLLPTYCLLWIYSSHELMFNCFSASNIVQFWEHLRAYYCKERPQHITISISNCSRACSNMCIYSVSLKTESPRAHISLPVINAFTSKIDRHESRKHNMTIEVTSQHCLNFVLNAAYSSIGVKLKCSPTHGTAVPWNMRHYSSPVI